MKLIAVFLSLSLLALSGCGLVKQKQLKADLSAAKIHCENLMQDSELDVIRNKIPLVDIKKATFDMVSNTQKVSDLEKPAIRSYAIKKIECQNEAIKVLTKYGDQNELSIIDGYLGIANGLVADLYNQQIAYGDFIRQTKKVTVELDAALARADAQKAASAQEAYRTYLMNQQTQNQRQIINNMNKPITCNKVGNYTYCN